MDAERVMEQVGTKLRDLRKQNGLTQQELADRAELTKGFISQLEQGQVTPSLVTLLDLIECLGTTPSDFFKPTGAEKVVFGERDYFEKIDETGNSTVWVVPSAQSNQMEPVVVTIQPHTALPTDDPHNGEEFGYVLSGRIALYRLCLRLFGSRLAALTAVLLYGLSGLGLSTMLMIRMYVLITLFSVLLALWITRLMEDGRPVWSLLSGLTIFLGLLTQYYFVFYAFFVCAAFVFYAAAKKRWKDLAVFALCAFAGVGLMVLVFPACITHLTADKLVSGGNALEQLSVFSQYTHRLLVFYHEVRHGMKAAVLCALALVLLLLVFFRKLRAAGKEKPLPWRSLVILLPAFAALVVVALISPVEEQRYIYNLAPFFAASVGLLAALLERALGSFRRETLLKSAALLAVLAVSLFFARSQPPKYLYPVDPCDEDLYAVYDAMMEQHEDEPCLYLTYYFYPPTQDLGELLYFDDVLVTAQPDSPAVDRYLAENPSEECVVFIDVNEFWSSGFDPEEILPALTASTDYSSWELLYENNLSVTYLLRK